MERIVTKECLENDIDLCLRPKYLNDYIGQKEVKENIDVFIKASKIRKEALDHVLLYGPPGLGKTTLAHIIAGQTRSDFQKLSATTSGVADLHEMIEIAEGNKRLGQKTILFIDEIHRWNKKQQDSLLPYVENGTITLVGATTENPSFEVVSALLSRCRVFVLKSLTEEQLTKIINQAIKDKKNGLGNLKLKMNKDAIALLAQMSNGDARTALNVLEYSAHLNKEITPEIIKESFQKSHLMYDKHGEEHFNIISALHKSMRGSDANAALYWLARMLEGGEDPLYVARRIVRFASEDIGLANSQALTQAVAAYQACHFIGMPECNVILAQAVVYMAKCKKSNELYRAYNEVKKDIEKYGNLPVPLHIRNAETKLMKELGYGKGYKYSPEYGYQEDQEYLPEKLKGKKYLKD